MNEVVARRPAGQMLAFFGLNCLGSMFWIKHGIDAHMPGLFIASAAASVVASGLLAAIEPQTRERWKENTRTFLAKPLHNLTGVPTVVAGLQSHQKALTILGACTIGGSLYAVWPERAMKITKSILGTTGQGVLAVTKIDKLMKALKIDTTPIVEKVQSVLQKLQPTDIAFLVYLGVIPTVFKNAMDLSDPYLAAAGACYTLSILSLPFRRQPQAATPQ